MRKVGLIFAIALGFFYMNGALYPSEPQTGGKINVSNLTFRPEMRDEGNYMKLRIIPSENVTGSITATYQMQEDGKALISDKKIFDSVTSDNPAEIVVKRPANFFSMTVVISDKEGHILDTVGVGGGPGS